MSDRRRATETKERKKNCKVAKTKCVNRRTVKDLGSGLELHKTKKKAKKKEEKKTARRRHK